MRRPKRDRAKPIPKSDLDQLAFFRGELTAYGKLREQGKSHEEATALVWAEYLNSDAGTDGEGKP